MLDSLLLSAVLSIGQAGPAEETPAGEAPVALAQAPGPTPPEKPPVETPPSVVIPAPLLPAPAVTPPPTEVKETPAPAPPDRWILMKALQGTYWGDLLIGNRMQIYGWTEGSYTYGSAGRGQWPMLAQSPTDTFLLNQNWLVFERTVVTSDTTQPTFGFRTAWILPGSDARYTVSRGLLDEQEGLFDFTQSHYPIDLFHAYVEAYFPTVARGLSIKIGKNAVPYFAETEDKINNPLFSHAYIFYYGGPFTHTGIQANLKLTDVWAVEARLVTGSDIFIDPAAEPTFVGALSWTQPGGRNTALLSVVIGPGRFDEEESFHHLNLINLVFKHNFNPRLVYTLDAVAGYETNVATVTPTGDDTGRWYGVAQYLTYIITPRLSATGRLEFFDDPQGLRTGFEGLYTAVTTGVTFKPRKGIWIRPELRYDYNGDSRPFNSNNDPHHGQFSVASDLILRW
jgi:hypothetical protein